MCMCVCGCGCGGGHGEGAVRQRTAGTHAPTPRAQQPLGPQLPARFPPSPRLLTCRLPALSPHLAVEQPHVYGVQVVGAAAQPQRAVQVLTGGGGGRWRLVNTGPDWSTGRGGGSAGVQGLGHGGKQGATCRLHSRGRVSGWLDRKGRSSCVGKAPTGGGDSGGAMVGDCGLLMHNPVPYRILAASKTRIPHTALLTMPTARNNRPPTP